ncbi:unnamed protein product, partial [Staurois parvus]
LIANCVKKNKINTFVQYLWITGQLQKICRNVAGSSEQPQHLEGWAGNQGQTDHLETRH